MTRSRGIILIIALLSVCLLAPRLLAPSAPGRPPAELGPAVYYKPLHTPFKILFNGYSVWLEVEWEMDTLIGEFGLEPGLELLNSDSRASTLTVRYEAPGQMPDIRQFDLTKTAVELPVYGGFTDQGAIWVTKDGLRFDSQDGQTFLTFEGNTLWVDASKVGIAPPREHPAERCPHSTLDNIWNGYYRPWLNYQALQVEGAGPVSLIIGGVLDLTIMVFRLLPSMWGRYLGPGMGKIVGFLLNVGFTSSLIIVNYKSRRPVYFVLSAALFIWFIFAITGTIERSLALSKEGILCPMGT